MLTAAAPTTGAVDFTAAFARLLRDGGLRDCFRKDPGALADEWGLDDTARPAFVALAPDDLEAQAVVLLRKRFAQIERLLPRTCAVLGAGAWPAFHVYSRLQWPSEALMELRDALDFCDHIARSNPEALCVTECNRVRFLLGQRRFALHFAAWQPGPAGGGALQLLVRLRQNGAWREFLLHA